MLKDQKNQPAERSTRSRKLSPELNEFLNMLDALEVQMSSHPVRTV